MIKVIFCDVSGTLLNSSGQISNETLKSIKSLQEKGIKFVLCSGGSRVRTRILAGNIGVDEYIISSNGADIFDIKNSKVIFSNYLNKLSIQNIYNLVLNRDMFFTANCDNYMLVNKKRFNEEFEVLIDNFSLETISKKNIVQCIISGKDTTKSDFDFIEKALLSDDNIEIAMKNINGNKTDINLIDSCYCDIIDKNTSKGNASKQLLEYLGILKEEALAICDGKNDISLFENVKYKIAMENAIPEIKARADYITESNNNDGVGKVLRRIIRM